jgi:autoinducer 2-degrading protein
MFTVLVDLLVRPDRVEEFLIAIGENATASLKDEAGCLVFEVHQSAAEPARYLLYEVYTDEDAFAIAHRAAPHYATWQAAAERCLEPGGRANRYFTPIVLDRSVAGATHQETKGP